MCGWETDRHEDWKVRSTCLCFVKILLRDKSEVGYWRLEEGRKDLKKLLWQADRAG